MPASPRRRFLNASILRPPARPALVGLLGLLGLAVGVDRPVAAAAGPDPVQAAAPSVVTDPVDLTLALAPGEPFRQRMTVAQEMRQEMPGMGPMAVRSTVILDVTHRVLDEAPTKGRFVLQLTVDRVRVDVATPMMAATRMDSDDVSTIIDNPAAAGFGPIFNAVGSPLRYELTEAGAFVADDALVAVGIGQSAGGQTTLRSFVRQMVLAVPGRPVAVDDTWTQTLPGKELGLEKDVALTWTLTRAAGETADLAVASTLEVEGMSVPAGPGMKGTMSLRGSIAGTATVRADGWITVLETKQATEGAVEVPRGPQPMRIPFSSTATTTIRTLP